MLKKWLEIVRSMSEKRVKENALAGAGSGDDRECLRIQRWEKQFRHACDQLNSPKQRNRCPFAGFSDAGGQCCKDHWALLSFNDQSSLSALKGSYKTKGPRVPKGPLSSHPNTRQ